MATVSQMTPNPQPVNPTSNPRFAKPDASAKSRSHYWQLPLFGFGLAAAVIAYVQFPPPPTTPEEKLSRQVSQLRATLDQKPLDVTRAESLAVMISQQTTTDHPQAVPNQWLAAQAFLLAAEVDPSRKERWESAWRCLTQIRPEQLASTQDRQKYAFRCAKAQAALGEGDPKLTIAALVDIPAQEEPEGERRRLLAETYLRESPPNWKAAQTELTAYVASSARKPSNWLAHQRLQLAQLNLHLGEFAKAKEVLQDIGPQAGAEFTKPAQAMLGTVAVREGRAADAVPLLEAALDGDGLPTDQRAAVWLTLAEAYQRVPLRDKVVPALNQAAQQPGPVALAAQLALADWTLNDTSAPVLLDRVQAALHQLALAAADQPMADSAWLRLERVREVFERAIHTAQKQQAFETAIEMTADYSRFATPGRATERRAELNQAWASDCLKQPDLAAQAPVKFKAAAADYIALAATFPTAAGKVDLLNRAAQCYKAAGDRAAAESTLDLVLQTPDLPGDLIAASWVEKADTLVAHQKFEEARLAYRQAMTGATPHAATARVKLALAQLDEAKQQSTQPATAPAAQTLLKEAEELLLAATQNPVEHPQEREAQHQALFELSKLFLNRGQVPEAEQRLRQLVQSQPAPPLALSGKLYLGSTLLLAARGDHDTRTPADAETKLTEAHKIFQELSECADPFVRTQADIRWANTTLLLRRYADMPELCERLAKRYPNQIEELIIRSMLYTAYRYADRAEPAAATLSRMEELFQKLPEQAFPGGADEYTRAYWQKQWFEPLRAKP